MRLSAVIVPALSCAAFLAVPAAAQSFRPAVVSTHLPSLEAVWHMRAALNVAALGCRDADEAATVAAYNRLLHSEQAVLSTADEAVSRRYKAQSGAQWQDAREHDMTQLYNFFAQPHAQAAFCATAKHVLAQLDTVEPGDLPDFALATLPLLEAPFWPAPGDQVAAAAPPAVVAIVAAVPVGPAIQR